jgi:hypothetical protein
MTLEDFTGLACEVPLEYTYTLVRGKLPEKVLLEKGRYWIPDLRAHPTLQWSVEKDGREVCCIWDKKYGRFVSVTCRKNKETDEVVSKTIRFNNTQTIFYIPICVNVLGDPPNIKSISIDHINRNHSDNYLQNLRWATPTEQNMNRIYNKNYEELDDWLYEFENIIYNSIKELYDYSIINNKINSDITYDKFKTRVSRLHNNIKTIHTVYGLKIIKRIKENTVFGTELWKPILSKYKLKQFTIVSNYGRIGRYYKDILIPRTPVIDKLGYQRVKLKELKSTVGVHTLVYEHFIGDIPQGYIIDHIDENKSNNHISNLQIMTQSQNLKKTMSINHTHKSIINIEAIDTLTNEILTFPNKRQFFNHFNITIGYYDYHIYKSSDNIITLNNKLYKINEIANTNINYRDHAKKTIHMIDINNNIMKSFESITEVGVYYKDNKIHFCRSVFSMRINTNKEYNIPGVFWKSDEAS